MSEEEERRALIKRRSWYGGLGKSFLTVDVFESQNGPSPKAGPKLMGSIQWHKCLRLSLFH